jgi:hypothetical protein
VVTGIPPDENLNNWVVSSVGDSLSVGRLAQLAGG